MIRMNKTLSCIIYFIILLNYLTKPRSRIYMIVEAMRMDPFSHTLSENLQLPDHRQKQSNQTHFIEDRVSDISTKVYKQFVFSDIDGTLVHYHPVVKDDTHPSLLFLPPSATGLQAHISTETLRLCQEIRHKHGALFVLVSGMRTKTLFQRIPYLPKADAYCSENGGRIFYPVSLEHDERSISDSVDTSSILLRVQPVYYDGMLDVDRQDFGLVEDIHWRRFMQQVKEVDPNVQISMNNTDKQIPSTDLHDWKEGSLLPSLQELATSLEQRNYIVDKMGYTTCIRLNWKQQRQNLVSMEDFDSIPSSMDLNHLGLQFSRNLGCIDFFPWNSGKKNCCEYIAHRMSETIHKQKSPQGLLASSSFCVCDDDNDIPLAMACKKAFLPTLSSKSMKDMVEVRGNEAVVTEDIKNGIIGFLATEEALRLLLKDLSNEG